MFSTKLKQQLAASQTALEQHQFMLQALNRSMAVIEFDLDGKVLQANDNFLRLMGYALDEVVGKHHSLFCDKALVNSPDYAARWARLRKGEFIADQFKRLTKQGGVVWLEASYNPVLDSNGKPYKIVKFATDITAKVNVEADARAKLEAVDRSNAIIEFTPDGTILTANKNFLQTMGYELSAIKGKHHSLFCDADYVRSHEYTQFWQQLRSGQFMTGRYKRLGRNGQVVWLEASYNPVFDRDGKLYKVVKFAVDISREVEQNESEARSASRAYHIAAETERVAEHGTVIIQDAATEMRQIADMVKTSADVIADLGRQSEQITAIVNSIRGIADQTNLLALNAAIEAARAGDQGRGFAVVADEVRSLAARTSRSTAEIAEMIEKIQGGTQAAISSMSGSQEQALRGVELANQAGSAIVQIRDGARDAVQAVSIFANVLDEAEVAASYHH
ncbi:PAS domain-containing methyl-accepting chemotaxis protein [Pokkaliibacter sp. MBI-7]|uniref:PAS domain-containing methyl-accepting chemotaxis protein n=1 Tax=Pokkaliibacter sp. MBI-7 TaxID=3040600 RepID=UPI00244BCE71|nr:PAS domain-containing methyl-accepting chemotaxis protein [Pokkaliibacter sp. MBI-7]MDH2432502.1 PAS domain-containing methyl-accepting chemotaxis protein [Pokkaliibacter sp. MBI-7]